MMKKRVKTILTVSFFSLIASCTIGGGTTEGAGIGSIDGDAELGATVAYTAGFVESIFSQ
jgi:hypothetical protein